MTGLLVLSGLGCATLPAESEIRVTPEMLRDAVDTLPPVEPGTLRIALAFSGESDLDLGVTDPTLETIRFARPRDTRGGKFSGDRGCGDPAPRIEIVSWKDVCPGRFEITVEHAADCGGALMEANKSKPQWQLRIDHDGVEWKEGRIARSAFVPIIFEVERTNTTPAHCRR
ncbi:MAG: hypothetical protein AB8G23_22660 [Myxococcota bacterium]